MRLAGSRSARCNWGCLGTGGWLHVDEHGYYGHFGAEQTARVPRELITRKAVAGTPDEAAALLTTVAAAGYTHAALIVMGDEDTVLQHLAHDVLPQLP